MGKVNATPVNIVDKDEACTGLLIIILVSELNVVETLTKISLFSAV